jgi:hypothetical protein
MKKIRIKRKGFGFELVVEGEIKIDESKIKSYEQYHKEETEKLLKEQIYEYLLTLTPSMANSDSDAWCGFSGWQYKEGAKIALKELAAHLAKNLEAE